MGDSTDDIYDGLLKKLNETELLITECKNLPEISGKAKLLRKIEAELRFLKRLTKKRENLKEEHIRSSNIYHLSAIVRCCNEMKGIIKVLETFSYFTEDSDEYENSLVVDIVADYGRTWVKVATRNPYYLYQASMGLGKYGRKSLVDQVRDMIECADQNLCMFVVPKIVVRLAAGVTKELKELLDELKVQVIGNIVTADTDNATPDVESNVNIVCGENVINELTSLGNLHLSHEEVSGPSSSDSAHLENSDESDYFNMRSLPPNAALNLDVSTFLAYVSNMTNGYCHAKYKETVLTDLAKMEQVRPVKIILDQLFKDRKLICCETAHRDFLEILSTVGGPAEKKRASEMLKCVTVVPDNPSLNALSLENTSKIKDRSKVVFGTGDALKAITVSANLGFIRAAFSQGVTFVAFVHESRAP